MNKLLEWIDNAAAFIVALFIILAKELVIPGIVGLTITALIMLFIHFLVTQNWDGIAALAVGGVLFAVDMCLAHFFRRKP